MDTFPEFWMVHRSGGGAPTFRHPTEDSAKREAERIARENPGTACYVLKATRCCVVDQPPLIWCLADPDAMPS